MCKYLVILLCCLSFKGSCQSRCDCFERLYSLCNVDTDYTRSVAILKDAISFLDTPQRGEYYWEVAQRYKNMRQYDSSALWYEKAIKWGYSLESLKWYSKEVYKRMDTNKIKAIALEHRKKIDFDLHEMFVAQNTLDQAIRGNALFSISKYENTSAPVCERSFIDSMYHRVDGSTFRFLQWVLENYGFPTFHQLGFYPGGISVMIMHVTAYQNENATYIFNKLEELSNNCGYMKSDVLFLRDRQQYINNKKTSCGFIWPRPALSEH